MFLVGRMVEAKEKEGLGLDMLGSVYLSKLYAKFDLRRHSKLNANSGSTRRLDSRKSFCTMALAVQFAEIVVNNAVDASQVVEEGPVAPSQSVLALINTNSIAPRPTNYRPAASSVAEFLDSAGASICLPSRENVDPALPKTSPSVCPSEPVLAASKNAGSAVKSTPQPTPATRSADAPAAGGVLDPLSPPARHSSSDVASSGDNSSTVGSAPVDGLDPSTPSSTPAASSGPSSVLPKRNKGQMGSEEKKQARAAAKAKSERLTEAVRDYVEKMDEFVESIATEQNITPERIRQLAAQVATLKGKRAVSNWNVLVHIKSKELNADCPNGSKSQLAEIQDAVHEDDDLMNALNHDKKRMAELRKEYEDDHADKQKSIMRVSTRSPALIVSNSINACQSQMDYLNDSTGSWGFGAIVRASYTSSVQSGFFGRGDIDGFMRKYFNVSVQEMVCLLEDYACTVTTMGNKKVPSNKMQSVTVELILNGLREISRVSNLTMSYARYDQDIRAAHGVMIEGWPDAIDFIAPSKLKVALQIQTLYDAWRSGQAHWRVMTLAERREVKEELAEREPVIRAKRSDAGGSHKRKRKPISDDEDGDLDKDNEDDDEAEYRPKSKKSRASRKSGASEADDGEAPSTKGKRSLKKSKPVASEGNAKSNAANSKKERAPKRKSATIDDDEDAEQPSKKKGSSKSKKVVAPVTAKEQKLRKKRKFAPGSKPAIAEAQFAESRALLEEMRREKAQKEAASNDEEEEEEDDEWDK
ncbi:hypothetical protein BT96DRAFT_1004930 [Gymnopus androsaceus JB14]|uniref:Uncharacterized protein n=1 Tax=Gymnopus androsaceus JB14 TaxID=1447944 RepID=A0A6A4GPV3_9AGAR|nr:hypothetical protein BT96DRAFT_1004930 [Gymnopus androsaceus JB14]